MGMTNATAVQNAWTTAKAHLTTFQNDLATLINDLTNLENDRDLLYQLGATDVADWLTTQIRQARVGYQPRISASGGIAPTVGNVFAPHQTAAVNTVSDTRPVSSTATAKALGLS
jgi:hypothetical protein